MPYTIDWFSDHTIVAFNGPATYEQLREIGPVPYSDSRFENFRYALIDFTGADLAEVTLDQPTILASIDSTAAAYNPKLKLAFVIGDEYQRTLCEQYIAGSADFNSSWAQRIFLSVNDARMWCDTDG